MIKILLSAAWAFAAVAAPAFIAQTSPPTGSRQRTPQANAVVQFDVASVKLASNQAILETHPTVSIGRFRWTTQLPYLIAYAYHMELWRISGEVSNSIYQIEATTDPHTTDDQMRSMLQSVLAERFKMSAHRVTREVNGFVLVLAKGGPKMQEASAGDEPAMPEWMATIDPRSVEGKVVATSISRGVATITGRSVTMSQLAETLERLVGTAVVEQTGLSGRYFFSLEYSTGDDLVGEYPDLFGAVKELGLKLEKRKGPIDFLVVDHIEKVPTEN